jgi:hypothetical protein
MRQETPRHDRAAMRCFEIFEGEVREIDDPGFPNYCLFPELKIDLTELVPSKKRTK